jgi:hypothetical protein
LKEILICGKLATLPLTFRLAEEEIAKLVERDENKTSSEWRNEYLDQSLKDSDDDDGTRTHSGRSGNQQIEEGRHCNSRAEHSAATN